MTVIFNFNEAAKVAFASSKLVIVNYSGIVLIEGLVCE